MRLFSCSKYTSSFSSTSCTAARYQCRNVDIGGDPLARGYRGGQWHRRRLRLELGNVIGKARLPQSKPQTNKPVQYISNEKNRASRNPTHTMASIPNPEPPSNSGPRKRKIPLDDNGEPVKLDKKKVLGPRAQKKAKTVPAKSATEKVAPVMVSKKSVPAPKRPTIGASRTRSPSVEIEEVFDKATDGSDDETPGGDAESAIDSEVDDEVVDDDMEAPEESDEAELSSFWPFDCEKIMLMYH